MVFVIKLVINGDIDEQNIYTKKTENYNFENFKEKINEDDIQELYQWDLEKKKVLKLFGKNEGDKKSENIHQLPINDIEYNYFGDLYICLLDNNKYASMDIEVFENIYNALYLSVMDEEENVLSEEENLFIDNIVVSEEDEEEFNIDNYGDDISDIESDEESKKIVKKPKKKKLMKKDVELKDILNEETTLKDLNNLTRVKTLEILLSLLNQKEKTNYRDYFRELEKEIFNHTINSCIEKNIVPTWNHLFSTVYLNKARTIYTNLKPDSYVKNKRLLIRLKKNEFTPVKLVTMNYQQLFPENWKELIDEKYRRDKVLYETKQESMTDQFLCKRCRSRETSYYEVQTRSADEAMTIFITCLNCGNRWKN